MTGKIVLVPFPFSSNPAQMKVRPAIIVSNLEVNSSRDVILAGITSHLWNDRYSFQLENRFLSHPLRQPSEIRCHYLFTIEQSLIIKEIAMLDKNKQMELFEKIKELLDPAI
jgi:mRNA-degrading endonuclease toxin of MazEF toxin-antitoxin module